MTIPTLAERNAQLRRQSDPLPGSLPHDNLRPINIPGRLDGHTLFDCLCEMHPQISPGQWRRWFQLGHILRGQQPMPMELNVRGGQQYLHLFPNTIEPAVNANIEILHEDEDLVAVCKPAPLPVHPCGRFNRNTLTSLLAGVYQPSDLRLVHRLDANTSGVMLLARSRQLATRMREQFESMQVVKKYVALCQGRPNNDRFVSGAPIARGQSVAGTRVTDPAGDDATTVFTVLQRRSDGTSLLEAVPKTGRTNQIRVHLWSLGMPVVGDPAYLCQRRLGTAQTLDVDQRPMCLHASQLRWIDPRGGRPLCITAPDPPWLDGTNSDNRRDR